MAKRKSSRVKSSASPRTPLRGLRIVNAKPSVRRLDLKSSRRFIVAKRRVVDWEELFGATPVIRERPRRKYVVRGPTVATPDNHRVFSDVAPVSFFRSPVKAVVKALDPCQSLSVRRAVLFAVNGLKSGKGGSRPHKRKEVCK